MSEINLYNLSIDELKEQARILGIVVRGNPGADTLREKIRQCRNDRASRNRKAQAKEDPDRKKGWITIVIAERRARPAACICWHQWEVIFHTQGRARASTAGSYGGAEQCQANRLERKGWNQQNDTYLSIIK